MHLQTLVVASGSDPTGDSIQLYSPRLPSLTPPMNQTGEKIRYPPCNTGMYLQSYMITLKRNRLGCVEQKSQECYPSPLPPGEGQGEGILRKISLRVRS